MPIKNAINSAGKRTIIALGIFCGLGFMAGFFTGFGYARNEYREILAAYDKAEAPLSADVYQAPAEETGSSDDKTASADAEPRGEAADTAGIELFLEKHELGSDENGTFITGTVVNRSNHAFDAVQIQFELLNKKGDSYNTLTERYTERIEQSDSWGFTIYIPYTEMNQFASYRLHGLMGTTKK